MSDSTVPFGKQRPTDMLHFGQTEGLHIPFMFIYSIAIFTRSDIQIRQRTIRAKSALVQNHEPPLPAKQFLFKSKLYMISVAKAWETWQTFRGIYKNEVKVRWVCFSNNETLLVQHHVWAECLLTWTCLKCSKSLY